VSDRELRELIASNSDTSTDPSVIPNPVNLVLEQTNLGRGDHWFDVIERRSFDILTEHFERSQAHGRSASRV
jgi:hypothetical protein